MLRETLFICVWVACGLAMLIYYANRKRTLKSSLFGMLSGGAALVLLHFFGAPIGFTPALGLLNTATALILGVPGVALMFAVNFIV